MKWRVVNFQAGVILVDPRGLRSALTRFLVHRSIFGSGKACKTALVRRRAMAGSSGEDIPKQLAALLGRATVHVRKTDENPPRISVIDVAVVITGHGANYASEAVRNIFQTHPDVHEKIVDVKFPDSRGRKGQKNTPATDVRGIVEIIMLLPGHTAARVRRQAAELLCRYLGGDLALVDEVIQLRGLQEELADRSPEDPRRVFGEAVETAGSFSGEQLARVCTDIVARALPAVLDKLTAHIDQRLAHLESRQRVNLNVRAPKRALPHNPPIARDITRAGRPYPVAKYLDEMERQDATWKSARRSFAPTFGMQVQVLKKKRLKETNQNAVYVEQNHRAQLLYTVEDRPLMEEAWALTAAHREDLASRAGYPQCAPAVLDRPVERVNVLDLLQRRRE